jgi:ribosomal protein S18 acetylase RimI-like enzyme
MERPAGYSARSARPEDVAELEQLFIALDREEGIEPSYLEEDMMSAWRRADFDVELDTFVVLSDSGAIVAYGHVEARPPTDLVSMGWVHPHHRELGLGAFVIEAMESRARAKAGAPAAAFERVVNVVTEWDRPAARLLEDAGYKAVRHFWSMEIDLKAEVDRPAILPGVTVRPFDPAEASAVHAVLVEAFQDHWGTPFPEFPDWSAETLERKSSDPSLWRIAEVNGEVVGSLVADASSGSGWVIDLGVLRGFRNRGIGRALLLHAFHDFKERGLGRAALGVDSESLTGATRLYEGVGMTKYRQIDFYAKDLVRGGT